MLRFMLVMMIILILQIYLTKKPTHKLITKIMVKSIWYMMKLLQVLHVVIRV